MKQMEINNTLFDKLPEENSVYRHFKGEYYKIVGLGIQTETRTIDVIYKTLTPQKSANHWLRDAEMFLSLADKEKYQDADQEERFRCVDRHIACARHALGLDKDGHRRTYRGLIYFHSWRNFYDAGGNDIEIMEDLAKWGFAGKNSSGTYYITRDGRLWLTKVCDDVDVIRGVNG